MVDKLYKAMKGAGTKEDQVDSVLKDSSLTSADIVNIMNAYESKYGKTLEKEIKVFAFDNGVILGKKQKKNFNKVLLV